MPETISQLPDELELEKKHELFNHNPERNPDADRVGNILRTIPEDLLDQIHEKSVELNERFSSLAKKINEVIKEKGYTRAEMEREIGNNYVKLLEELNLNELEDKLDLARRNGTSEADIESVEAKYLQRKRILDYYNKLIEYIYLPLGGEREEKNLVRGFCCEYAVAKSIVERTDCLVYYTTKQEDMTGKVDWWVDTNTGQEKKHLAALQVKSINFPPNFLNEFGIIKLKGKQEIAAFFRDLYDFLKRDPKDRVTQEIIDRFRNNQYGDQYRNAYQSALTLCEYCDSINDASVEPVYIFITPKRVIEGGKEASIPGRHFNPVTGRPEENFKANIAQIIEDLRGGGQDEPR